MGVTITDKARQGMLGALEKGVWSVSYVYTLSFGEKKDLLTGSRLTYNCSESICEIQYTFYPMTTYILTGVDLSGIVIDLTSDNYIIVEQGRETKLNIYLMINVSGNIRAYYLLNKIVEVALSVKTAGILYVYKAKYVYRNAELTVTPYKTVINNKLYVTTRAPLTGFLQKIQYLNTQDLTLFEQPVGKNVGAGDINTLVITI